MRRSIVALLVGISGAFVLVVPALAATSVSFAPVTVNVSQGQSFTLTVGVNPGGVKNYTVKTELQYPANLLEVTSFAFANTWMPLTQSGYDLTDNTNGVLVKTAGYPGGVSSAVTFGTVTFHAKKSGTGTIALDNSSLTLDAGNQNVLASAAVRTTVAIAAPSVPTQTAPVTQVTPTSKPATETVPPVTEVATTSGKQLATTTEQPIVVPPGSILAQVATFVTFGTNSIFLGIAIIVVLVFLGYAIYSGVRSRRKKHS